MNVNYRKPGAGGGSRTPTGVATRQILSLVRLPVPPLRRRAVFYYGCGQLLKP